MADLLEPGQDPCPAPTLPQEGSRPEQLQLGIQNRPQRTSGAQEDVIPGTRDPMAPTVGS